MPDRTTVIHRSAAVIRRLAVVAFWLSAFLCGSAVLAQSAPSPSASRQLLPENELLLDLRVDGQSVELTLLAYRRGDQILVALSELMDGLQFPINVDASQGVAGGWFIKEEREFVLDMGDGSVFSDGQRYDIGNFVVAESGDLFVTTGAIEQWFPLRLQPEIRNLAINVIPVQKIPLQDRLNRLNRGPRTTFAIDQKAQLPLQPTPYHFLGPHAADIRLNTSTVLDDPESSSTDLSGTYSILSRGDLLWMTSTIAVTGRDDDDVTGGRFKLERGSLDAPLALDYVEVGDVDVSNSRGLLVRGGGAQEGLSGGLFSDESVDLRGDIPPDWEVELYRNGVLIDFQVVGSNAQYEFLDVPLEFGENVFEFVFYGPFGDERRDQKVYFAGRNSLEFGEVSYELAAVQDGRTVFDLGPRNGKGDVGSERYLANLNIGLFSNLSAGLGLDSFERNEERLQDYNASLTANFATLQANAGYRWREQDLDEASLLLRTRLGEATNAQLRYTEYLEEDLEPQFFPDDPRKWTANATLNSKVSKVPYVFNTSHEERQRSSTSTASLGTTLRVFDNDRFSTSINYFREENESAADTVSEEVRGAFSFSTSMRPWSLRAGADYDFSPDTEINSVFGSATLRVDSNMYMNFDVDHTATSDYTSYRIGFNWLLDYLQISPQVIYDSNERWVGLVSLSTSINPAPERAIPQFSGLSQTGFGSVRSRVFVDNDGDGEWSEGDEPLPGVQVDALQSWRRSTTDAQGNAYLNRMYPGRRTDIAIDPTSVEDIELSSTTEGVSVEPRPSSWSEVNFPMVRTMELEGHVYSVPSPGAEPVPQPRAPVMLVNADGEVVSSQRAAFDGFYLFSSVPPGTYQVRAGKSIADDVVSAPEPVEVTAAGGVVRDLDFVLEPWRGSGIQQLAPSAQPREEEERPSFAPTTERPSFAPEPEPPTAAPPAPIIPVVPEAESFAPEPVIEEAPLEESEEAQSPEPESELPSGNWFVQLGAFGDAENAESLWASLKSSDALNGPYQPVYEPVGSLTRLLIGPGLPEATARELCSALQAQGNDCLVKQR